MPFALLPFLTALTLPLAFAAALAAPLHRATAQDAFDAKSAAHLRDEYLGDLDSLHVKILALANAIPADKYSWRPAPGVRSISEAFMHVASEWFFYVPQSIGRKPPADFGVPKETMKSLEKITTKHEVIAQLDKSWKHTKTEVSAADASTLTGSYKPWNQPLDRAAFEMAGDLHEHLGQLISYARSVGVKPPWSK